MRFRTLARCSASVAVLALSISPASAQDDDAPVAVEQAPAPTPEEDEASIVVTGLRRSLESQQNIRRNSDQIVDAIVAADIGKLPDIAVSDTAARIPGVQVERGGGEAGRVLVRGLPDFTTTYNGREIFTAETRSVALQDFPSGAIGAIEVFKSSSANLIEPGLAGLVNVRSRRPFDFDGFEIVGSLWGLHTYQADEITPNGNLLVTNRWAVGDGGEIGALIGLSYTRLRYLDSTRENTDFVAGGGPNGTRFPDIQRIFYGEGDRSRPSINASIQYRPSPGVEFYVEGLWQGFRNRVSDRLIAVPLWGGSGFSNTQTQEGRTDLLESGTVTNPFRPDGFQGGTFNKTNTYQFAIGGSYDAGPLRISADLARTDSTFTGSTASVDYAFANRQTVTFDTDVDAEDGGAEFSFANFDASNPANYIYRGFYEEAQQSTGDDWQARVDLAYEAELGPIEEFQFGIRYTDRDAHREFGNRYWNFEGNRIPISQVPLDYVLFDPGFRGSGVQDFRTWLSPTYRSIRDNLVRMREFNMGLGGTAYGPNTNEAPTPDPLQTWDASEQSFAAYAQVRYEIPLGGEAVLDGNIGLRYVKSDLTLSGTRLVIPGGGGAGVLTPTDVDRDFEAWLPSFNARLRFTPQFQARLSFTQTQTRPSFIDLRASGTLDQPPACLAQNPPPANCFQTGSGGNPFLEPLTSDNYDAALEYYFSRTGFVSLSLFRRDMQGFIENTTFQGTTPDGVPLRLNGPVNSGDGRIQGFEAQITTFFDFLGVPQVGFQANVTHIDASADFLFDRGTDASGAQLVDVVNRELIGVSDWSYNLVAIYEGGGLSARLAYNWRSSFLTTYQRRGDHLYTEEADPVSRLDLSVSYNILDNLTIFGDWTNILGDPFTSSLTRTDVVNPNGAPTGFEATFPRFVRFEETTISIGARFRF
ncbi:MAG TPA: TonB-dependent receptor [Allosphingosinicella sp.]|nr:TonB-dependent receptor [Allosphingosinicella sp.]